MSSFNTHYVASLEVTLFHAGMGRGVDEMLFYRITYLVYVVGRPGNIYWAYFHPESEYNTNKLRE